MNRTEWLENRRMQKFRDVLSRWASKKLSASDAAEILGMSERSFLRYRRRHEEESASVRGKGTVYLFPGSHCTEL